MQDQSHTLDVSENISLPDLTVESLFEDEFEEPDYSLTEYDISSNPNDFNVITLNSYIERDAIKIPSFQRNYVWDIKRASRWIESLLLGLPVPQLFLYEEARNSFLVIDGQQRLMTIYYFVHGRFPRTKMRSQIREIFDREGRISPEAFSDNSLFQDFRLKLGDSVDSPFNGLTYETLDEYRSMLELRTVRSMVIKQNQPRDGDSSIFEIFNRLNTGGINLRPQEIRTCMYRSHFYEMLSRVNTIPEWRRFFGKSEPDLHLRDVEVILRAFAMLEESGSYNNTMTRFLNEYSRRAQKFDDVQVAYLEELFRSFVAHLALLGEDAFLGKQNKRFNINLFESVMYAACKQPYDGKLLVDKQVPISFVRELASDEVFLSASTKSTANASNVRTRLERSLSLFNSMQSGEENES